MNVLMTSELQYTVARNNSDNLQSYPPDEHHSLGCLLEARGAEIADRCPHQSVLSDAPYCSARGRCSTLFQNDKIWTQNLAVSGLTL